MSRRLIVASIAAVGVLFLSACSTINYAGTGNRFVIQGTVIWSGPESVKLDSITVTEAEGEARSFFNGDHGFLSSVDHREVHNNYSNGDFLNAQKNVGIAYGENGGQIKIDSIAIGQIVKATGRIRASHQGKTNYDRAVFDELVIVVQAP